MKKIASQHGLAGIYKGQVVTLWREAVGYGIYFWAYEKLMQREMASKGIRRDQVNPANAVLFGAAAGYAVSAPPGFLITLSTVVLTWVLMRGVACVLRSLHSSGLSYTL